MLSSFDLTRVRQARASSSSVSRPLMYTLCLILKCDVYQIDVCTLAWSAAAGAHVVAQPPCQGLLKGGAASALGAAASCPDLSTFVRLLKEAPGDARDWLLGCSSGGSCGEDAQPRTLFIPTDAVSRQVHYTLEPSAHGCFRLTG